MYTRSYKVSDGVTLIASRPSTIGFIQKQIASAQDEIRRIAADNWDRQYYWDADDALSSQYLLEKSLQYPGTLIEFPEEGCCL